MSGKTTCKEVCSSCKCTIIEKTKVDTNKCGKKNDKKDCVATIVGVLSLPENFCCQEKKDDGCGDTKKDICCSNSSTLKNDCCDEKKDECTEVYRDLGECLQKCIVKTSKNGNSC